MERGCDGGRGRRRRANIEQTLTEKLTTLKVRSIEKKSGIKNYKKTSKKKPVFFFENLIFPFFPVKKNCPNFFNSIFSKKSKFPLQSIRANLHLSTHSHEIPSSLATPKRPVERDCRRRIGFRGGTGLGRPKKRLIEFADY